MLIHLQFAYINPSQEYWYIFQEKKCTQEMYLSKERCYEQRNIIFTMISLLWDYNKDKIIKPISWHNG